MAIVMTLVTVCFGGLWALGYIYITAMACAYGSATGRCSGQLWNLRGDDLYYMILIPGAIFLVLLVVTILLWRLRSEPIDET